MPHEIVSDTPPVSGLAIQNRPHLGQRAALLYAGAFGGGLVLAFIWYLLVHISMAAAVVWPLNALGVVLCLRLAASPGERAGVIAAVALGNACANVMTLGAVPYALLFPICGAAEMALVVWAAKKIAPDGFERASPRQAALLALVAAVCAPAVSGALSVLGQGLLSFDPNLALVFFFWWSCNSLGMMIVLPLGLGLTRTSTQRFRSPRARWEALAAAAATLLTALIIFSVGHSAWTLLMAPGLVYATFRFGVPGAAGATLIVAVASIASTVLGHGPIADIGASSPFWVAGALQAFLCVCWLVTLPPAVLLESFAAELRTKEDRLVETQMLAADAQNRMLRYQLNPHFFFNTLTALSSLIQEGEPAKADLMVVSLSRFLRHSLEQSPTEKISLKDEIDAQERYLQIEQIRFGDRLAWVKTVSPAAEQVQVPSFILQPLIENAIKHAVATTPGSVRLELRAEVAAGALTISMIDDGRGKAAPGQAKLGVGLENVRRRLALLYGRAASLTVAKLARRGFVATITMPADEGVSP